MQINEHSATNLKAIRTTNDLVGWMPALAGDGAPRDLEKLTVWCERHVTHWHWYGAGHSQDDCDDIVQGALLAALEFRGSRPECADDELARALVRALDKLKKRKQRDQSLPVDAMDGLEPRSPFNHEDDLIVKQRMQRVRDLLFDALESEIPRLGDRGHDLVVRHYGFEAFFPLREGEVPPPSPAAKRKALYRARRQLSNNLAQHLRKSIDASTPGHSLILEVALEVVTEEKYREAFELMEAA